MRSLRRPAVAAFLLAATVVLPSACGSGRSVEAFCSTYKERKANYLDKYNADARSIDSQSDPLLSMMAAVSMTAQSMGDLESMFDALDKVAPDSIEPDVAIIRDQWKQSIDSVGDGASNPWGAALGQLVSGLAHQGSWTRVGNYVQANCHTT